MKKYETGLLLSKIYPDEGQLDYAYDAFNRLASTTWTREVSAGTRVYVYNNYNEVESETLTGDAIAHAVTELRDAFGRGTGYVYAKNGNVQQTTGTAYAEATGRLATACFVHGGAEKTFTYNYLSGTNLLESLACPSNLTLVQTYEDKRDLVTGMRIYRGAGTDVVLRNYTYDALGRPLTRTTSRNGTTQNDTFGYNPRSELTSATLGNANYAYAFDNIGNRETSTEAGTALAYTANNLNQYTEICSAEPIQQTATPSAQLSALQLSYDADGNATLIQTFTGTWSISYNGANRPVRFRNEETDTTVECGYDSQGRRYFKKVTVAGTVTLHHRYIYRGYLQIACVDCTRSGHPALWFVTWDPSQATATRPLAIQKDGTWFTYGYDLTKNVCEVFGPAGYIRTSYSYAPFGNVTESGDVSQPFQWSSEVYDSELNLVYYNFRHYSPALGRFLSRDPIAEQGGLNLYAFVKNNIGQEIDSLGGVSTSIQHSGDLISEDEYAEEYDPGRIDPEMPLPIVICSTAGVTAIVDGPLPVGDIIAVCLLCAAAIVTGAGCYQETMDKNQGKCNPCLRPLPPEQHHQVPNQHGCRFGHWHGFRWDQKPYPACLCFRKRFLGGCLDEKGRKI